MRNFKVIKPEKNNHKDTWKTNHEGKQWCRKALQQVRQFGEELNRKNPLKGGMWVKEGLQNNALYFMKFLLVCHVILNYITSMYDCEVLLVYMQK